MRRQVRFWRLRRWWAALGPLIPGMMIGCTTTTGPSTTLAGCPTIPKGAIPSPPGTYLNELRTRQATKAEYDDFVIYHHEWYLGGEELGPYGKYHLGQIARRLPVSPGFPVVLEPVRGQDALNENRRRLVVNWLAGAGIADAAQRVIVGYPGAEGLYGEEAPPIYIRMLQRNQFNQGFGNGFGGFGGLGGGFGNFGGFGGFGGFGLGGGGFGGFGGGLGGFGGFGGF
jgi:hypothetical protein